MKKLMSYTVIALLATIAISIASPNKDMIMEKEKAAWQAFKDKKADDFKKVVDHDMVGVYAEGIADMEKEMADMMKWDMKSFAISDYKAISDEKDVMVASYTVTIEGTFDGQGRLRDLQCRHGLETGERQVAGHFPHQHQAGRGEPATRKEESNGAAVHISGRRRGVLVSSPGILSARRRTGSLLRAGAAEEPRCSNP